LEKEFWEGEKALCPECAAVAELEKLGVCRTEGEKLGQGKFRRLDSGAVHGKSRSIGDFSGRIRPFLGDPLMQGGGGIRGSRIRPSDLQSGAGLLIYRGKKGRVRGRNRIRLISFLKSGPLQRRQVEPSGPEKGSKSLLKGKRTKSNEKNLEGETGVKPQLERSKKRTFLGKELR